MSGQADCNRYFGAYTLDEAAGTLRLRDLGSTLAYCGDASLDRAFLAVLQNARTFTVDGTGALRGAVLPRLSHLTGPNPRAPFRPHDDPRR